MHISEPHRDDPRANASKLPTAWDSIQKADIAQAATLKTLQNTADDIKRGLEELEAAQITTPAYIITKGAR
jgi:hypothetical protein